MVLVKCKCRKDPVLLDTYIDLLDYYPRKDTINVGDTLYFRLKVPKEIKITYKDIWKGGYITKQCRITDTSKQGNGVNFYKDEQYWNSITRYEKRYDIKGFYKKDGEYILKEEDDSYVYECGNIINKGITEIKMRDIYIYIYGVNNTCNEKIVFRDPRYEYRNLTINVRDTTGVVAKP